ncbi:hypothetical protein CR513_25064, partial [Mucuna pruriens]
MENYDVWAVKMEAYLEALDLWEVVEDDYEVLPLLDNPTMTQIKNHKEKKTRKAKAKSCLFAGVSTTIFTRIVTFKSAKAIWDYLKGEYAGDERIWSMMKESKTIKEYSNKLLSIVNKIRLLGSDFADSRIVEKILVTIPERYEASITSLENSKDLSNITLAEVLHALMAQEQRRLMREDRAVEGALPAKHHDAGYNKKKFCKKNQPTSSEKSYHLNVAQVVDEEEQLFVATCFAISNSSKKWLIDSGCTNHMTFDHDFFKELDTSTVFKVKIGNGEHIAVKGKGTVEIESI